ncbi:MAG: tellurite resistance TerB family protein [Gammaproteobacteria bacterium]|jgi:uncharacterized membrane protein YebE (DUF533 family)
MSIQNLLNQFIGSSNAATSQGDNTTGMGDTLNKLTSNIPGGLVGGAAAGGIMALLMGNKSARKFAGKAATYGGAAMLGGLALKAYQNWQKNSIEDSSSAGTQNSSDTMKNTSAFSETLEPAFELTVIKAMIAAAKADGHIDDIEQRRIFKAVDQMDLSNATKGMVFDLLRQTISVEELAAGVVSMEQKSEIYLASCLTIDPDQPAEQAHLDQLATALELPQGLAHELQWQAQKAITESA